MQVLMKVIKGPRAPAAEETVVELSRQYQLVKDREKSLMASNSEIRLSVWVNGEPN